MTSWGIKVKVRAPFVLHSRIRVRNLERASYLSIEWLIKFLCSTLFSEECSRTVHWFFFFWGGEFSTDSVVDANFIVKHLKENNCPIAQWNAALINIRFTNEEISSIITQYDRDLTGQFSLLRDSFSNYKIKCHEI